MRDNKNSVNLNRIASKFCHCGSNDSVSKVVVGNDYYIYHVSNIGQQIFNNNVLKTPLPKRTDRLD